MKLRETVERTSAWAEAASGAQAIAAALEVARKAPQIEVDRLAFARRIVLTGAGSSLYIAQVAAATMREVCHLPGEAVPLSEVLLRPDGVFPGTDHEVGPVIVVSRSGTTTEALEVIRSVRAHGHHTLAVTCRPDSSMAALADSVLAVPEADERAVVMTRSVAAMASLLMRLGARVGEAHAARFVRDLDALPGRWEETGPHVERAFELATQLPSRVVVLGGGAAHGIANEAVLKLTEMSQVPASAYHPMEFRHGPISVCEPGVLVVGILGGPSEAAERRVLEEAAALGATTWELGPRGPGADLGEIARLLLVLHPLQALAFGAAAVRGRDPEAPRHLGHVVVIGADG
jgi:glucosamine--fructose-6-phosphate aminotransferase (isomerizing)